MMNIFDGGVFFFQKEMLQPPIYGFCLSDLSNNKERGNDKRMKKIEGCRWSVSFVRRSVHASSKEEEMREQEERRWEKKSVNTVQ